MKKYLIYTLLIGALLASCKQKPVSKNKSNNSHTLTTDEITQRNFDAAFYEGNKQMVLGNHNDAITQFKKCISLIPQSDVANYLLAKEYNITHQYQLSLPYAETAVKINGKNVWYKLLYADNLKHINKSAEAAEVMEKVADDFNTYETYYFDAAESYARAKKYNEALRCLDKLEKKSGVNEEISFKKEELYLQLEKKDKALAELKKLINAYPQRIRYKVALAEVYFRFSEDAKAEEILKGVLAIEPRMPEAHMLLAKWYRSKGDFKNTFEELKIVFANPDADVKEKLEIISSYLPMIDHSEETKQQALELGALLTTAHPTDDGCNAVYADILFFSEKYEQAKQYYLKALKNNKTNFNLWQNLLRCEDELKMYEEGKGYASEAVEAFPSHALFYYYKAFFAFQLKDYTTTAQAAKSGYDIGSDNTQLVLQLLSLSGSANNSLKNFALSDEAFDKILLLDPNNILTLNNYSYFLALRKEKLDKAETMAKKALEIDPNNASYADTYGWVLYQQKKYNDALIYIEKAQKQQPTNAVLNEHLGDTYFHLNNPDKAMDYWKKARENGNNSDTLQQKINTGKLID